METIQLLPLAQAEILNSPPSRFLEKLFAGKAPAPGLTRLGSDLIETVLAGGYPEALSRKSWVRRQNWHMSYVEAIVGRDVRDIANIDQLDRMPRLLRALAEHSSQLVNYAGVGASLDLNHVTTRKYTGACSSSFSSSAAWRRGTTMRSSG